MNKFSYKTMTCDNDYDNFDWLLAISYVAPKLKANSHAWSWS